MSVTVVEVDVDVVVFYEYGDQQELINYIKQGAQRILLSWKCTGEGQF